MCNEDKIVKYIVDSCVDIEVVIRMYTELYIETGDMRWAYIATSLISSMACNE